MKLRRLIPPLLILSGTIAVVSACAGFRRGPVGNAAVPMPAKAVDLKRYLGLWYEIARYDNGFETGCEGVTAEYRLRDDGLIQVINTCRQYTPTGPIKVAEGRAKVVEESAGARLKVSFFGPFLLGDYWILDHDIDYAWSIVGEPSGRYLWLLSRTPRPDAATRQTILNRAISLGYDPGLLRETRH